MKTITGKPLYKVGYWAFMPLTNTCKYMVGHFSALELLMVKHVRSLEQVGQMYKAELI